MLADPLHWIEGALRELEQQGLRRGVAIREGPQQARVELDGRTYINFGSNDYLGLAGGELHRAVAETLDRTGWGSGASPLVTGRGRLHAELESQLARFEGTEATLLFASGYAANAGTISALVGRGDAIFSDAKNHASIIDGCQLSKARVVVYPHCDAQALGQLLERTTECRRKLIVTDGLFSMDGDRAPLEIIAELAERHGAMLMVDEAHATGVFGLNGRGVAEAMGVEGRVHIRVGTLSKALGSSGGFVAGPRRLIDWLVNRSRAYIYSTAPPEAMATAALRALEIVRSQPERRQRLLQRAAELRRTLRALGHSVGSSSSHIIPVILGDPQTTMRAAGSLRERGLLVPGIRPPTVPPGESLLRISLTSAHSDKMIERLVQALGSLG